MKTTTTSTARLIHSLLILPVLGLLLTTAVPLTHASDKSPEQLRAEELATSQKILSRLYQEKPTAQAAITHAGGGFATFHDFGLHIFIAGGGSGSGVAHNNRTGQNTFMKMVELQAGIGFGIKKFAVILVFDTPEAFDSFVNKGWEFGGQGGLTAKADNSGISYEGAVSVAPGIWMYQLTDTGLAAEITIKGTKYYKNDDLN